MAHCSTCQQTKYLTTLLQPIPPLMQIWKDVSMDFIIDLPTSIGFRSLLVIVDHFSKAAHFRALLTQFSASKVTDLFTTTIC